MTEPITRSARRVLICGSRTYRDAHAIARIIFHLPNDAVVIHGAAKGADSLADLYAHRRRLKVLPFPADWKTYHKGAGPIRNKQMLDEGCPTEVIAFVTDPVNSTGTDVKGVNRIRREYTDG